MSVAFSILAWATLGAVYLEACMSLADRLHRWRHRNKSFPVRALTDYEWRVIAEGDAQR